MPLGGSDKTPTPGSGPFGFGTNDIKGLLVLVYLENKTVCMVFSNMTGDLPEVKKNPFTVLSTIDHFQSPRIEVNIE